MRTLRLVPLVALTTISILTSPATTVASCALPPGNVVPTLEGAVRVADVAFVGTVASTSNGNTSATVQVEEVWRGPDQPRTVLVHGGFPDMTTSADRMFEVGARYLFLPAIDPGRGLTDNACSMTTPWTAAMAALRPPDARPPIGEAPPDAGLDTAGLVAPIGVAFVVALVLLGVGLLARGRQAA